MIVPNPEHDLGLDPVEPFRSSLEDGVTLPDINAKWSVLSKECKGRKQKWITRYANRLNDDDVRKQNMSLLAERQARIESTGWRNVIIPKGELELPTLENTASVEDLAPFESQPYAVRSACCWVCWQRVGVGARRVQCCSCPLVAHEECVGQEAVCLDKEALIEKYLTYSIYSRPPTARDSSSFSSTPLATSRQESAFSGDGKEIDASRNHLTSSPANMDRKLIKLVENDANNDENVSSTTIDNKEDQQEDASSSSSVAVVLEDGKEIVYKMDFKPVATEEMPSKKLQEAMRLLDDDAVNPTSMNLDSLLFTEFSPLSEQDLRFRVFKTFLYKLKPSVRSLSLRFNLMPRDWQTYLIEWVQQNEWLEQLHILGTAFDVHMRGLLAEAWGRHLSSHLFEDNGNTLLRIDMIELRVKASDLTKAICPFCLDDLGSYNSWRHGNNSNRLLRYKRLACVITLQSFFRMLTARLRYKRGRKVILSLQRKHRAAVFWKKSFAAKILELRPFRLRIHKLNIILHLDEQSAKKEREKGMEMETKSGKNTPPTTIGNLLQSRRQDAKKDTLAYQISLLDPPNLVYQTKLGSIPAAMYHHLTDDSTQSSDDLTKKLRVVKEITSGTNFAMLDKFEEKLSHENDLDDDDDHSADNAENSKTFVAANVMKSVLKDGYTSRPNYLFNPKLNVATIFKRGDYILTITVNSYDVNDINPNKQLYRIDYPVGIVPTMTKMKLTKELRRQIFIDEKLMENIEAFNHHFRLISTSINNVMILLPAVPASTTVTFTLSEVVSYPKVVTLGQVSLNLYHELLWRKGVTVNTSVDDHSIQTFDIEDPHSSKIVFLKRVKRKEQKTDSAAMSAAIKKERMRRQDQMKNSGKNDQQVHKINVPGESFASASLLVSAIPGSYDDSHGGAIFLHQLPSLASAKSRVWMVLMDRTVYIYNQTTDITPMVSISLKSCTVTKTDDGVVILTRTKSPAGSWYIHSPIQQQNNLWFSLISDEINSLKTLTKGAGGKNILSNTTTMGSNT